MFRSDTYLEIYINNLNENVINKFNKKSKEKEMNSNMIRHSFNAKYKIVWPKTNLWSNSTHSYLWTKIVFFSYRIAFHLQVNFFFSLEMSSVMFCGKFKTRWNEVLRKMFFPNCLRMQYFIELFFVGKLNEF